MIMSTATRRVDVLKVGGAVVSDDARLAELAAHVAERAASDVLIVVHGGGDRIADLHARLGLKTTKVGGLRATPPESMDLVTMALRGAANTRLVSALVAAGVPALGLSGADLALLRSSFLNEPRLGRVGGPPRVDADRLLRLTGQGYVPVLAPICLAPDGGLLNVNADSVAHAVAVALGADSLDFVSDVPGVYGPGGDVEDRIRTREMADFFEAAELTGGMIPKLQASAAAIHAGVGRVRVGTLATLAAEQATEIVP